MRVIARRRRVSDRWPAAAARFDGFDVPYLTVLTGGGAITRHFDLPLPPEGDAARRSPESQSVIGIVSSLRVAKSDLNIAFCKHLADARAADGLTEII